ncbi:hypothetical protein [Haloarchaeobius amylolyticus]|uniref:hypothetical protein n=1 Tax=Haloarchaeobius amylolyticus TaxID=1198296 RepID=UPI0022721989|nr:hypothetical protein [Haloarchaeobius amylolyticus]
MLKGEWRVLGFRAEEEKLLLHPLFEVEDPGKYWVGAAMPVGTANYGGDLQELVDALEPGNRVYAGVYPGRPGRFAELELLADQRLLIGFESETVPTFVHEIWLEALSTHDGAGPVAVSRRLDVPGTVAELYVASATDQRPNDLWWVFVGGGGDDAFFESFEHAEGTPAEFVAANPESTPYFWVVKFGDRDTAVAKNLANQTGIVRDPEAALEELLEKHGMSGSVVPK